jgi:hypothetical protein
MKELEYEQANKKKLTA